MLLYCRRNRNYYPYYHASRYGRGTALSLNIASPVYDDTEFDAVPYLEAVATWDQAAEEITIFAVNRNLTQVLRLEGDTRGFANYRVMEHITLSHPDLKASNTEEEPQQVVPETNGDAKMTSGMLHATLPKASWNVIRMSKAREG